MIIGFSVIWPYLKTVCTLGAWLLPPRWLSLSSRGSMLLWLDALGKWSMLDIFVMVITLAAFRHTLLLPERVAVVLPNQFLAAGIAINPNWGLYANTLAQVMTQLISHWVIYLHRAACVVAAQQSHAESLAKADGQVLASPGSWGVADDGQVERLSSHVFTVLGAPGTTSTAPMQRLRFSRLGQALVLINLAAAWLLLIVGAA